MNNPIHKFEQAGLGKAPFRVVGYEAKTYVACPGAPVQVGGSCDYCGAGIIHTFYIESADGHRSHVGSECVMKTGDAGLTDPIKKQVNRLRRAAKAKRDSARIDRCRASLSDFSVRERLTRQPHPKSWEGKTLLDWAEWMMQNAGTTGCLAVCRIIEAY